MGSSLRAVLTDGFKPLFEGVQATQMGLEKVVIGFFRGPFLLEENQRLHQRLAAAQAHEETHRQLFQENARLRNLLDFKSRSAWRVIPAEVIGHELRLWSRTLVLNKGTNQEVYNGMAVITPTGLVGRVSEVGSSTSRVILVTDPHFRVSAALSQSRVSGLVTGNASGDCLLTYLPLDTELKKGEPVLTSGGRSFCPEGIWVGTVLSASPDSSKLFLSARIRPAVNGAAMEEVLLVRTAQE